MNDFFLLNNETLPYEFIDQKIEIRQIKVKEIASFARCAEPIKSALESYSVETIKTALADQLFNIMQMCEKVTNLDAKCFIEHADNLEAIAELLLKIIEVNEAYFKKENKRRKSEKESTWFDSFQFLVSMGHQHGEIMEMTYGAFQGYVNAANKLYKQEIFNSAIAARVAQADKKGFDSFKKEMISD